MTRRLETPEIPAHSEMLPVTPPPSMQTEQIYSDFRGRLFGFLRRQVHDEEVAEDLLQEVFLKIQKRIGDVRDPAKLESWIFRLARNAAADFLRERKSKPDSGDLSENQAAPVPEEENSAEKCLRPAVRGFVSALPDHYSRALRLVDLEGMSHKELSEVEGITLTAAKSRVRRGRQLLKKSLLDCCTFELDVRGRVIDYTPRVQTSCSNGCSDSGHRTTELSAREDACASDE